MKIGISDKAEIAKKISTITALSVAVQFKNMLDYCANFMTFIEIAEIIGCSENYLYKIRIKNQEFNYNKGINSCFYFRLKKLYDELKKYENQ